MAQPDHIRALIKETIETQAENHGQFNFFKFNQFLGKYQLTQIAERASDFVGLFSGKGFATGNLATPQLNKQAIDLEQPKKTNLSGLQF